MTDASEDNSNKLKRHEINTLMNINKIIHKQIKFSITQAVYIET